MSKQLLMASPVGCADAAPSTAAPSGSVGGLKSKSEASLTLLSTLPREIDRVKAVKVADGG